MAIEHRHTGACSGDLEILLFCESCRGRIEATKNLLRFYFQFLFFAGDTAYQSAGSPSPCPAFVEIGKTLGPFDLATVPIGLMTPQAFMGSVHATPEQSLNIHKEIKSKLSIGMHYGTVRGGISAHYEDVRDPPRRWRAAAEKEGLWSGGGVEGGGESVDTSKEGVGLLDIGETVAV